MDTEHELVELAVFRTDDPYWRYYCSCGVVGGRTATREGSERGFARHATDDVHGTSDDDGTQYEGWSV